MNHLKNIKPYKCLDFPVLVPSMLRSMSSTRSLRSRGTVKTEATNSSDETKDSVSGGKNVKLRSKKSVKAVTINLPGKKQINVKDTSYCSNSYLNKAMKVELPCDQNVTSEYFEPVLSKTLKKDNTLANNKRIKDKGISMNKKEAEFKTIKEASISPANKNQDNLKNAAVHTSVKSIKMEITCDNPVTSEYIEPVASKKEGLSPRKRKIINAGPTVKAEKEIKIKTEPGLNLDIEDMAWEPVNWREVLDNILEMRKLHVAPVDSLGCEECPDKTANPEVFRYQTLISVMLSSQTRDEVTYAATQKLINHGLTIDSILSTPDEKIGELIYPAGFWKSKTKYIKNTTQILKDQYGSDIPRTFKDLCKLPGVGPKMANIVMSVAWNDTVGIAVDTHVHRISNRLGWVPKPTKVPEQTRTALENWLPKDQWRQINLTLVGFGQTICKPVGPSCEMCLNSDLCPFGRSVLGGKKKKTQK